MLSPGYDRERAPGRMPEPGFGPAPAISSNFTGVGSKWTSQSLRNAAPME